ncbi:hypothetical protein [Ktedonobacter racemifer]|uniref:Uncharacterized protein n=1 Tax=Ktedonobacter racemifer DSM 44963 TaxID=485913 RepID=D6TVH8_KTERA|nr:hypothetical protein [Ktedonobacter racemifer]EFH80870.1 hypothetical protein Krac_1502 [Ktedonobacter racemifer DSM 44963]EFH85381.1 hypothetical protein Krac_6594 [Ktedonobacter racemifer DSM 44963]
MLSSQITGELKLVAQPVGSGSLLIPLANLGESDEVAREQA